MKITRLLPALIAFVSASGLSLADQSLLNAGDLVFLAANSDAPDTFDFAPLVDIEAGTVIHFSDNSRTGTGTGFADWRKTATGAMSEGPYYTWVASSAVAAGTKISIPDSIHGAIAFAAGGDNLFAFQGDIYNPRFIGAVGWTSTDPFITTGVATANNSYVPSSLVLGTSAVEIAVNTDNTAYTGVTSGTTADLRTAVNTAANWTVNETVVLAGPASLAISDAAAAVDATKQLLGYGFGAASASYSESATVLAANTTLSSFGFTGAGVKDVDGSTVLTGQGFQVTGGWDTNALDVASQYFGFVLTVDPGSGFTLEDFGFAYQSSENITIGAFYSTDGFVTSNQLGLSTVVTDTNVGAATLTNLGIAGLQGAVEFRFYGSDALTGAGPLEIDEVWLQGSVAAIPEPASAVLGALGFLALLRRRR